MTQRIISFWSTLLVILLLSSSTFAQEPIQIIVLAGQSNMAGCGDYDKLSSKDKKRIINVSKRVQLSTEGTDLTPLNYTHSDFQKEKYGFGNVFGPELFIGVTLAEANPGKEFILIKRSQGGTALYGAWNPEWDAKKADRVEGKAFKKKLHLCDEHQVQIESILKQLDKDGKSYEISGMVWMQGENDAAKQISASSYADNLKKLVTRYRTQFNVPYLPFVFGQINSNYGKFTAGPEMVRSQMLKFANEDPFAAIVLTKNDSNWADFPKHHDQVHYNAVGQKRLGIALATKMMALQNSKFAKPQTRWGNSKLINQNWLYLEKDSKEFPEIADSEYQKISLPHTWNAKDVLEAHTYRKASSWYRKYIQFAEEDLDKRQYIRFQAAGQQAFVYVNGEKVAEHFGGYSAFTVELTDLVSVGKNKIDVRVSNADDNVVAPKSADFNFYGGLYRSVELISAPELSISRKHLGSNGIRIWSEKVNKDKSDVNLTTRIDNGSNKPIKITVLARLISPSGKIVSEGKTVTKIEGGKEDLIHIAMNDVINPELWSPEKPTLYTLKIEVKKGRKLIDTMEEKHGFRWFKFTADKGFFLNGEPYKLNGVNRHQDYIGEGNAVPLHRHFTDLMLMKEIGINWLRLAHYQQDDYMLQLCDELGMLVWEEVPFVNGTPKNLAFVPNLQAMLTDLINQHFNHPSIILWGMGNEVWMGDRGDGYSTVHDIVKGMNDIIHKEDPVRKSVFVNGDNDRPIELKLWEIPDVFGYNLYRGWYNPSHLTLTERVNELHKSMPGRPLIISEYGAGSDKQVHSETPKRQDFSIEYQNEFLISHLNQFDKMDWLAGTNRWAFADFGAAHRGDTKPHVNQKGIVTFDRKPKDIFHIMKSRWNNEPMVYLESPSWNERSGNANKKYRVYSNMNQVELIVNGKSLGTQNSEFIWDVNLKEGNNTLIAIGTKGAILKEHGFDVTFNSKAPSYSITASKSANNTKPANLVDGDPTTAWESEGASDIIIDLDRIRLLNGAKISFDHNFKKDIEYQIAIYTSKDAKSWEVQFDGKSNRRSEIETFLFKKQQEVRYLKIAANGHKVFKKKELKFESRYFEITPLVTLEKAELNLYEKIGAGID